MPYLSIDDFKYGMDRRRGQAVGIPGTLWTLKNAVVSRGGDIVRAKKWVKVYDLPEGKTFGLEVLDNALQVFGGQSSTPASLHPDVEYNALHHEAVVEPGGSDEATTMIDARAKVFDDKLYVIAKYDNGDTIHWYDGSKVTHWKGTVALVHDGKKPLARALAYAAAGDPAVVVTPRGNTLNIRAVVPGVTFTAQLTSRDLVASTSVICSTTTVVSNVVGVAEVRATGTITITSGTDGGSVSSITVDGVELLDSSVAWFGDTSTFANALVVAINDNTADTGISASAVANVITLKAAAGTGATPNGDVVAVTASGVAYSKADMSGGVTAVEAQARVASVALDAPYDEADTWDLWIDAARNYYVKGFASGMGTFIFVHKGRVWCPVNSVIRYSKLNDPSDWTAADASSGASFINIGSQVEGARVIYGAEEFSGKVAFFGERAVVLYTLAADAQNIAIAQTLKNTGTASPYSIIAYGADDVFYLDRSGIRSLKARSGYDSAMAGDVGNAVDAFVRDTVAATSRVSLQKAQSVIEPEDGRFMLAIGDKIIVLSRFPDSRITAWSYFDMADLDIGDIDRIVQCGDTIYVRSGEEIYAYGGIDGTTYPDDDEFETVAETSFMSARDPDTIKQIKSYGQSAVGEWLVEVLVDPNDTTKAIPVGRLTGTTFNDPAAWLPGWCASFALRFTCDRAGFASLSSIAQHFEKSEQQ